MLDENHMNNPWNTIALQDYEQHMSLDSIGQLQALSDIMKKQFLAFYDVKDIIILGVAGGNGLQHITNDKYDHVYGLDINEQYLKKCMERFPHLNDVFNPLCVDLREPSVELPKVDYVIANLLIEYIGYESFCHAIEKMKPNYVSCVIQLNESGDFVSDSPYVHAFDDLANVHHDMCEKQVIQSLKGLCYSIIFRDKIALKNGKALLRMDFKKER